MRRYLSYIICAICAIGLCGCATPVDSEVFVHDAEVTLNLSLCGLTRNDTPDNGIGEGDNDNNNNTATSPLVVLNENRVETLDIFLYANGAEDENATFATRITGLGSSDRVENVKFTIPIAELNTLFARNATTCGIYVIANYDTGRTTPINGEYRNTSLQELKNIEVQTSFDTLQDIDLSSLGADYGTVKSIKPQELFVMDSDLGVVTKSGYNLASTIYLTRAASKITFRTTIAESININGKVWVPVLENLSFAYNNVVNKGYIDNGSDEDTDNTFAMPTGDGVYADIHGVQMSSIYTDNGAIEPNYGGEVEGVSSWVTIDHVVPLYSYSSRWLDGESNEAYILLTVPWKIEGETDENLTYYSYIVPLNMNDLKLVRNKHYRINLRVGVLGDLEELNESEYSYEVIDWVGESIEVKLNKPSYLVVEYNYVVMNNIEEISIGYQSSDAVSYEVRSTTISAFKSENNVIVSGCVHGDYTVSIKDGMVTFLHELDNTRSDTDSVYDFLTQTTVLRIYHTNNRNMYQDITIVQHPAITVTTYQGDKANKNYLFVNGNAYSSWDNTSGAGRGCPTYNGVTVYWMGIGGKNPNNLNPDIYKVAVSALDASTAHYLIADPRAAKQNITIFPGYYHNDRSQAPDYPVQADQRGVREIKGYRGTVVEGAENLIAPEFIISSFMSTCTNADENLYPEDSAFNRCAAYQEAGYPAGRWRIPTTAELEVIGKLCAQGKLPTIFTENQVYPSSSGLFKYHGGNFTSTSDKATSVRCVYDTWYWRDKCTNNSMTRMLWAADGNVADMKANNTYNNYLVIVE